MDVFLSTLIADPLYYAGLLLSVLAAAGIALFLAGVGSESRYVWNNSGNVEHRAHARTRIFWGAFLTGASLGVWEILRFIAGEAPASVLIYSVILLCPLWIPWLKSLLQKLGEGGANQSGH